MKLCIIGAGGARTPLVVRNLVDYSEHLPVSRVCLMDVDSRRLALMQAVSEPLLAKSSKLELEWTTSARQAIQGADFVVTAFRTGLMASRAVDEQVPLRYGVLGQETTGPGGFAMAMRTIPVMLEYVRLIQALSPGAWLLNFTNPAGMVTEAVTRLTSYERAVGICDTPAALVRAAADFLGTAVRDLIPEYYGLNHLGWLRGLDLDGQDQVPRIVQAIARGTVRLPGLPFDPDLIAALAALPNEYLYFYYYPHRSVDNLCRVGQSRAQQIISINEQLYADFERIRNAKSEPDEIMAVYARYLAQRQGTYMTLESGEPRGGYRLQQSRTEGHSAGPHGSLQSLSEAAEGYAGVMLRLIEAMNSPGEPAFLILNVPNRGALPGMSDEDVVEVTCTVGNGMIRPMATGSLPDEALDLMKRVKTYERLTIQAAAERSYTLAVTALAHHPLVPSHDTARAILNDYIVEHKDYFPRLH